MPRTFFGRTFGNNTGGAAVCPALDVPVLAVADNANGTGGVATITGATAGTTNTLWAWPWGSPVGSLTRTTVGSRSGNGTVTVSSPGTLTLGPWLFLVESRTDESVEASNLVFQWLTDGAAAVHERCIDAAAAVVAGLNLSGIGSARTYSRALPDELNVTYPCAMLTVLGVQEQLMGGTNSRDDVGYPVRLQFLDQGEEYFTQDGTKRARLKLWRQRVSRAFRNQPLPGVNEIYDCDVEPGVVCEPVAGANGLYVVGDMVLRFISREIRGLS